jgi:hypothetical protein
VSPRIEHQVVVAVASHAIADERDAWISMADGGIGVPGIAADCPIRVGAGPP